jgi:putative FmdB family regulatory protein
MPLYEYECDVCGHRFEKIQKFSDPQVETCPKCGGAVRKLLSSPAIQFKGSGWYITDYARKDSSTEAKADGATAEKGDKKAAAEATNGAKDTKGAKDTQGGAEGAKDTKGGKETKSAETKRT